MMLGELTEEERVRWLRIVISAVIAGLIIFAAPEITAWITGISIDSPQGNIPRTLVDRVSMIFMLTRYFGGAIVTIGVIAGVIKL
ncbi:MAG: hypothetical protein ACK4FV_06015 [Candidatus Nitrosocaldus sp.]